MASLRLGLSRRRLTLRKYSYYSRIDGTPSFSRCSYNTSTAKLLSRPPASRSLSSLTPSGAHELPTSFSRPVAARPPHRPRRQPPSVKLVQALEKQASREHLGSRRALPKKKHPRHVDHCYISPLTFSQRKSNKTTFNVSGYEHDTHDILGEATLQSILAKYIELGKNVAVQDSPGFETISDQALVQVFDEASLTCLDSKGYDVEDVISWAWIIQAPTGFDAAIRLLMLSNEPLPKFRIPTFVFLFLLRRKRLAPAALKLLLLHAWDRLENRLNKKWQSILRSRHHRNSLLPLSALEVVQFDSHEEANYPIMQEDTVVIMVIRLLQHARWEWPAAIPSIIDLCTKTITGRPDEAVSTAADISFKSSQRLTFLFNKLLCLVARPPSQKPFMSVIYQERAQFNIIRKMNTFDPPLTINRDGYRAIIQVQIAHRKTLQERSWALLKSKSWPPWKEDKLGIDSDKGTEMGVSRAYRAIKSSTESGYAGEPWEYTASILSGWDTDQSPTIQTRTILPKSPGQRFVKTSANQDEPLDQMIWEARIRATRTIEEAWACFLAYQDQNSSIPSRSVYLAMFQKIAFERKRKAEINQRRSNELSLEQSVVPGDMLETEGSSTNPRDMIYVRKPPPNFETFYRQMLLDGVRVYGRTLEFLLYHAQTLQQGCEYLLYSDTNQIKAMLVGIEDIDAAKLRDAPPYIFVAFIHLLTRFPAMRLKYKPADAHRSLPKISIIHAIDLISAMMPPYRRPWIFLLSALKNRRIHPYLRQAFNLTGIGGHPEVDSWRSALWIVEKMGELELSIDFTCFQILCARFEKLALASKQAASASSFPGHALTQFLDEKPLKGELAKLKVHFKKLVSIDITEDFSPSDSVPSFDQSLSKNVAFKPYNLLPHLLEVPDPAKLHAFVRALGSAEDYRGLRDLIRWMSCMAPELSTPVNELAGGPRLQRRTLVAFRVYFENEFESSTSIYMDMEKDDKSITDAMADRLRLKEEVKTTIEMHADWGGWPTDEEVDGYISKSNWK